MIIYKLYVYKLLLITYKGWYAIKFNLTEPNQTDTTFNLFQTRCTFLTVPEW